MKHLADIRPHIKPGAGEHLKGRVPVLSDLPRIQYGDIRHGTFRAYRNGLPPTKPYVYNGPKPLSSLRKVKE